MTETETDAEFLKTIFAKSRYLAMTSAEEKRLKFLAERGAKVPDYFTPTHRHKKRGSTYEVVGDARLQTELPLLDDTELVIYRGEDGHLWARPVGEFMDGRFEPLTTALTKDTNK